MKHKIDKTAQSPLCRKCDKKSEIISHIVSECEKLAQKECKRRHDNVARIVHWKLCVGNTTWKEVNKNERSCAIIDIAIPGDIRVSEKEKEKIERCQELKRKIKIMWNIRSIKVIPVVVGTLGSTSKKLKKCMEELGVV